MYSKGQSYCGRAGELMGRSESLTVVYRIACEGLSYWRRTGELLERSESLKLFIGENVQVRVIVVEQVSHRKGQSH